MLLIEGVNEIKRLCGNEARATRGIVPTRDKASRALSVQPVFRQGLVLPRRATGAT